jgi:hypothetical protein
VCPMQTPALAGPKPRFAVLQPQRTRNSFATQPGSVGAQDEGNSPFTKALTQTIPGPGSRYLSHSTRSGLRSRRRPPSNRWFYFADCGQDGDIVQRGEREKKLDGLLGRAFDLSPAR